MKKIDACGMTCPAPVLLVKDTLEKEDANEVSVVVDSDACRENVTRFLNSRGYTVEIVAEEGRYRLDASRDGRTQPVEEPRATPATQHQEDCRLVVMITSDRLGRGDDELGKKLMINYIKTVKEMGPELWRIIFVNSGVKLTVASSPVVEELRNYQNGGGTILACGTCLEHFGLLSQKEVGETTNMLDIVTTTQLADKVITL